MPDKKLEIAISSMKCAESKDFDGLMALFTEDAILIDPHYPKTHMQGHAQIAEGMNWGFSSLNKLGFEINDTYASADGNGLVISVHTAHELPNGKPLNFPQLLVFEFEGELIKSLEAYVQHEPDGIVGLMLKITRIKCKLTAWKNRLIG